MNFANSFHLYTFQLGGAGWAERRGRGLKLFLKSGHFLASLKKEDFSKVWSGVLVYFVLFWQFSITFRIIISC